MDDAIVPPQAGITTAFEAYPQTLAKLKQLQTDGDSSLLEGTARVLQLIALRPIDGEFRLSEDVLERFLNDNTLSAVIADIAAIFLAEQVL